MSTPRTKPLEPNFEAACQWWSDLPNIWTPIGWKDHLFRFNVFWNGMIVAKAGLNRRTEQYQDRGLQAVFTPSILPTAARLPAFVYHDDGMVRQGWQDREAPVLWSEWANDGLLLRQDVFAHVPGGGELRQGDEPLFAWVRLTIHDLCASLPLEDHHGFLLHLGAPAIQTSMEIRHNVWFAAERDKAIYPRTLQPESAEYDAARGWRVLEPDGMVRLGLPAGQKCSLTFTPPSQDQSAYQFHVRMEAKKGRKVDLLLPMLPVDRETFDRELALGYDKALREAERFWSKKPAVVARVTVPETFINQAIERSAQFGQLLAEQNPATGQCCLISGSFTYANLWTTPMAMHTVMLLDLLGWHEFVGRHLEIFRQEQGTVTPPGEAYGPHPGFLSTPPLYKSIDWLSDNGAILYAICMHAMLSGDEGFTARFTDAVLKSCRWIRDARRMKAHGGAEGVLPPAVATDRGTKIQAVWSDAWNYKGLSTAVRLLRRIGHPQAGEFAREADDYREAFLKAFRRKARQMRAWTDARGKRHLFAPTSLSGDRRDETRHAFYLDGGPLFLVFAGLMDAADPLMSSLRQWFRAGPARPLYRRDSNCWQVPALEREMSSCEPCYSWNVFHSHRLGDRARFLEGMYSLFAGALSRRTCISCETRGGITGTVFAATLATCLARLAVIDDEIEEDELHLLRLMPLAWLPPGRESVFERMPTVFGPVTLRTKLSRDGRRLDVDFEPQWRKRPRKVILHVPPLRGLAKMRVNGGPVSVGRRRTVEVR